MQPPNDEILFFEGRPSWVLAFSQAIPRVLWGGGAIFLHYNHTDRWLDSLLSSGFPEGPPAEVRDIVWWAIHGLLGLIAFFAVLGLLTSTIRVLTTRYRITNRRVQEEWGLLSRSKDNLELARVTDVQLYEPFLLRMFRAGNILLRSSDRTSPYKWLRGLPNAEPLMEQIANVIRPTAIHEFR